MSEYFSNLPLITYDLDRKKPSTEYVAVDIFRRNFVRDKVLSNIQKCSKLDVPLSFEAFDTRFGDSFCALLFEGGPRAWFNILWTDLLYRGSPEGGLSPSRGSSTSHFTTFLICRRRRMMAARVAPAIASASLT